MWGGDRDIVSKEGSFLLEEDTSVSSPHFFFSVIPTILSRITSTIDLSSFSCLVLLFVEDTETAEGELNAIEKQ
jgi:hypothetical protein